jgi:hypothetical protein
MSRRFRRFQSLSKSPRYKEWVKHGRAAEDRDAAKFDALEKAMEPFLKRADNLATSVRRFVKRVYGNDPNALRNAMLILGLRF